ncbi:hypothetical protein ACFL5O_01615, partial [Myxococcota bacterium]
IARRDRDLASPFQRALSSTALDLTEGFGSQASNARLWFESARGSRYQAQAALRVAAAWGLVDHHQTALFLHVFSPMACTSAARRLKE